MKLFNNIKSFFRPKYYALYELITLKLMLIVNSMLRKLILSKGKDPDYVVPPPPEPEISDLWKRHYEAIDKMNSQYRYNRAASLNNKNVFKSVPTVAKSKIFAEPSPALDNALNVVIAAAEEEVAQTTDPIQVVSSAAFASTANIEGTNSVPVISGELTQSSVQSALQDVNAFIAVAEREDKSTKIKELVSKMASKGLCDFSPEALAAQEAEIAKWTDEAFSAFSKVFSKME
jgi:hypothetical protein